MKVSQADTINLLYKSYNDTINNLKIKILKYDSQINKIHLKDDTIKNLNWRIERIKDDRFDISPLAKKIEREKEITRFWIFILFMVAIGIKI